MSSKVARNAFVVLILIAMASLTYRLASAGDRAVTLPDPQMDCGTRRQRRQHGGDRRRLLLGHSGGVPTRQGREERDLRLFRRGGFNRASTNASAQGRQGTRSRCASPTIRRRFRTANC